MPEEKKCPEGQEWDPNQGKCVPCPGGRIRSKGKGRGEGYGKGKGPVGVPIGEKTDSGWENV
jgi:hypothetical protein